MENFIFCAVLLPEKVNRSCKYSYDGEPLSSTYLRLMWRQFRLRTSKLLVIVKTLKEFICFAFILIFWLYVESRICFMFLLKDFLDYRCNKFWKQQIAIITNIKKQNIIQLYVYVVTSFFAFINFVFKGRIKVKNKINVSLKNAFWSGQQARKTYCSVINNQGILLCGVLENSAKWNKIWKKDVKGLIIQGKHTWF